MPVTELLNTCSHRAMDIFSKFHVKIKFLSKAVAHEIRGTNSWDTLSSTISYILYNPGRISALYSSYYHLYSVVCVFLEPMSFPKFLIVAQSVLKLLNFSKVKSGCRPKMRLSFPYFVSPIFIPYKVSLPQITSLISLPSF